MKHNIFWFRRDLRLEDNAGLYHALRSGKQVQCIFIFDQDILDKLEDQDDARVHYIHNELQRLQKELHHYGSSLAVYYGTPLRVWQSDIDTKQVDAVFTNKDFEPYAIQRDTEVQQYLAQQGIGFQVCKDHVIFEKDEVLKADGSPYIVFTPYKRKWLERLYSKQDARGHPYYLKAYPTLQHAKHFLNGSNQEIPSLSTMGFSPSSIDIPSKTVAQGIIKKYKEQRNFPAINGTSRLGIHFRFGTISIREKARKALSLSDTYLSELIWRDFYAQILAHFPHVVEGAFRQKYERIEWRNNEAEFEAWCAGKTGYPIVDAGMRELNTTGHMHNRVRMIVASFLTKHLLIDWRWGEAYFARKLLDFDLASNNGGWQWASGSGTDAAPYFRIFNPTTQHQKFDKQSVYVKKWVPEYGTEAYLDPIVDHKMARERCLETYKKALKS